MFLDFAGIFLDFWLRRCHRLLAYYICLLVYRYMCNIYSLSHIEYIMRIHMYMEISNIQRGSPYNLSFFIRVFLCHMQGSDGDKWEKQWDLHRYHSLQNWLVAILPDKRDCYSQWLYKAMYIGQYIHWLYYHRRLGNLASARKVIWSNNIAIQLWLYSY